LNDEQRAILWQEVDPESVLIRPDGIVYLPWAVVWRTLLRAFSPYVPSIVPLSKPAMQDGSMCQHVVLLVQGKYIGDAVGECRYRPGNPNMSWPSAAEGAISDAIVKISKRLGMFQELWSIPWINAWKATHAIRVYRSKSQAWQWRRIDDEPFPDEGRQGRSSPGEGVNAQRLEDEIGEHFDSLGREPGQEG
jgi:hypothetical protein